MKSDVKLDFKSRGGDSYDIEMVLNGKVNMTLKSVLENVDFDIVNGKLLLEFEAVTIIHLPQEKEVKVND